MCSRLPRIVMERICRNAYAMILYTRELCTMYIYIFCGGMVFLYAHSQNTAALKNRHRNNPKMKISNKNICNVYLLYANMYIHDTYSERMWFSRQKWLHSIGKYLHESDTIILMQLLVDQFHFCHSCTYLFSEFRCCCCCCGC